LLAPSVPLSLSNLLAIPLSVSQINLSWNNNDVANTDNIIIQWTADGIAQADIMLDGSTTSHSLTLLEADTYHTFIVFAQNTTGNSNPVTANATTNAVQVQIPTAPTLTAVNAISQTTLQIVWTDNSYNEDNFIVQRSLDGSTGWETIATPESSPYNDTTLSAEQTRYYQVAASNGAGQSAWSGVVSGTTSATPVGGTLPDPNLFYDGFETGDMTAPNGPSPALNVVGFSWDSDVYVSIVTGGPGSNERVWRTPTVYNDSRDWTAKTGDYSLRFNYLAGQSQSEQRFSLAAQSDFWMRYWVRVPTNYTHNGGGNNKWLAIWTNNYDDDGDITFQTRPTSGGASKLVMQDGGVAVPEADIYQDFIDPARDQGRWMQFVVRAIEGSSPSANDGIIQAWRRWEDEQAFTQLLDKQNAGFYQGGGGIHAGYILGWANAAYAVDTEFLLDTVEISNESLV
jgi:hypothetical protein